MTGEGAAGGRPEPDAVEQVQRAVLTAIGAARVALDALESLVADRERLDHFAAGGRDLVESFWATVCGRPSDARSGAGSSGGGSAGGTGIGGPGGGSSGGGSAGGSGGGEDPPDAHPID
jgi:hypothetical protein